MSENRITTVSHLTKKLQDDPCVIHFVSPDASTAYFIRVVTKVASTIQATKAIEAHLKDLNESLYIDKRELRLTRDEKIRQKIAQKVYDAIHHSLLHARVHLKHVFDDDRTSIDIFFSVAVDNAVFAVTVGSGTIVKIVNGKPQAPELLTIRSAGERPLRQISIFWNEVLPGSHLVYLSEPKPDVKAFSDKPLPLGSSTEPEELLQMIKKALSSPQGAAFGHFLASGDLNVSSKAFAKGAEHLGKSFLFKDLSESEVALVLGQAHTRSFKSGDMIYREGSPGQSILILSSGEITIVSGGIEIVTRSSQGETFGESGFFEGQPRSASLIAKTDATLLEIYNEPLWDILTKNPGLGLKIVTKIAAITARKLRETTERYKAKKKRAS